MIAWEGCAECRGECPSCSPKSHSNTAFLWFLSIAAIVILGQIARAAVHFDRWKWMVMNGR